MNYVLITGATGGIGYELAKIFALKGYGLILISSNENRLKETKERLRSQFSVPIYIFEQDLTKLGAAQRIYDMVISKQIRISILVNNAGCGLVGATEQIDLQQDEDMLIMNVINLVELSKLFLRKMFQYGSGKILNVSSTGAFQPGPYTSTYFASKAFVLSYSRAIRYEAKSKGVQIASLCPGATKTNFFTKEGTNTPVNAMPAKLVAEIAYKGLNANKEIIIPGVRNKILRIVPLKLKMYFVAHMKNRSTTKYK